MSGRVSLEDMCKSGRSDAAAEGSGGSGRGSPDEGGVVFISFANREVVDILARGFDGWKRNS